MILRVLPVLLALVGCSQSPPPPPSPPPPTVFDSMTRQERALPAAVERARDEHMRALKRQEAASEDAR